MEKKLTNTNYPTEVIVQEYEMLSEMVEAIYIEMKEFSKKKPDEPLNKFKVKNVNRILKKVKDMLDTQPVSMFLDLLDDDTLPSYGDAILVIAQFKASLLRFKNDFWLYDSFFGKWRWSTKENPIEK